MRRKGPIFFFSVAILLAVGAAYGSFRWLAAESARAASTKAVTSPVVVAADDLGPGQRLEPSNLKVQQWPRGNLPEGSFTQPRQVLGRVVRTPLVKGEVVLGTKLAGEGLAGGLSAVLPAGLRAMTVRVDEVIGVAGFVQIADLVDVLVTVDKGPFREDPLTKVVLQRVVVMAVGEQVQEQADPKKPKTRKVTVVTLQLTPEQGERLALAATEGKVILALRNQADQAEELTAGIRLTGLVPVDKPVEPKTLPVAPAPPVQAKAAPARPQVEVIKGVERSVQAL